ncbi:uncharacterized protein STEHIDRAFT_171683 [Stereum hirsutum FP-91666 SS1]|uniref:uncharacterized protein n=1 Tax=Stereum hirsutum (strain FP-91666) TaxID=721885 RepID=UPI000444A5FF|nr:uncharacterized protein STEHIDRAFT_171683 [Stereum hirsutum FP-91666 SS1]EIM82103.1 hypothetical protein STEHIDRAFT_171683 [Stereum hirsutum FP-91666 SS1]
MGATLSRENGNASIGSSGGPGGDSSSNILIDSHLMSGYPFDALATGFVTTVVAASFISAFSVILLVVAIGTLMNAQWVIKGAVYAGDLCSVQGGIKQMGNVAAALWSFMIALHTFNLLFLRRKMTALGQWLTIAIGWTAVMFIIIIGPLAIQTPEKGPYFGISGYWCWITDAYPAEQTYLEYFFEWLAAFFSFILYTCILLRVRGNLIRDNKGVWTLRWVPSHQSWQLSVQRDMLDTAMRKLAASMVWHPVAYTILIVPITLARFISFAGSSVPPSITFLADFIFNLSGLVNLILVLTTRRLLPDLHTLPDLTTPRLKLDKDSPEAVGNTPFVLQRPITGIVNVDEENGPGPGSEGGRIDRFNADDDDAVESGTRRAAVMRVGKQTGAGEDEGLIDEKEDVRIEKPVKEYSHSDALRLRRDETASVADTASRYSLASLDSTAPLRPAAA